MAESSVAGYSAVSADKAQVITALRESAEFLIDFFIHEQLAWVVPKFHVKIFGMMVNMALRRVAIAVPRGHAKTTLAKLAVVWHLLFTHVRFVVYVSNTGENAIKAVNDIIDYLQCSNFVSIFGPIKFSVRKHGDGEFVFWMQTPRGEKEIILKARGANQAFRGINIKNLRPELAIVDDLEDVENTETENLQRKLDRWFYGTFVKALSNAYNKVVFIGNMVNDGCLLGRLCDGSNTNWTSMLMGALLKDGKALWPDMWPLDRLIADYKEFELMGQASTWFAEMMNIRTAGKDALMRADEIYYMQQGDVEFYKGGFITIDPATGVGKDNTAIVVNLMIELESGEFGCLHADYSFGKLDENATVDAAIALCYMYGLSIICIESIAYQRALATVFELVLAARGIVGFDIIKTYPGNASKANRLRGWAALVKQKIVAIAHGSYEITQQIIKWQPTAKENDDDIIDACAMAPEVMMMYKDLILSKKLGAVINAKPVRQVEMC